VRVVALLAEYPRGHEINLIDVRSALASEMGISKPETVSRHITTMCHLGFLELTGSGSMMKAPTYKIGRKGRQLLRSEVVGSKNEALEAGAGGS